MFLFGNFVALAIVLNSASAKFRKQHDGSIKNSFPFEQKLVKVTYRLKEGMLESGNKVEIAHFKISQFRWYAQYE